MYSYDTEEHTFRLFMGKKWQKKVERVNKMRKKPHKTSIKIISKEYYRRNSN